MIKYLTRQFGLTALAAVILFAFVQVQGWRDDLRQNTQQVASAVTCHGDGQELALAASIDASMLRRMNHK